MPVARASRTIPATAEDLWRVVSDPWHLPRWWPRVERVEGVADGAFTEVMRTKRGSTVRADFDVVRAERDAGTLVWEQQLHGTPFAGVLAHSRTELRIEPLAETGAPCEVTIEMRQELAGQAPRPEGERPRRRLPSMGRWMLRRAASRTIAQALDGLERISG